VYTVCSGSAVRLADAIRTFEAISGIAVEIDTDPAQLRCNELSQIFGDSTKIRTETAWSLQIPLEKIILDLLDYWRERIKGRSSTGAQ
jgi:nucleoside-diphosphate-sugar epimerase